MRRNRNGVRKDRIIMWVSSVMILAALTVTGVVVRNNRQSDAESNVVDFSAIESEASETAENIISDKDMSTLFTEVGTDDLDYDPSFQEANSGNVENNDNKSTQKSNDGQSSKKSDDTENEVEYNKDGQTGESAESDKKNNNKENSDQENNNKDASKTDTADKKGSNDADKNASDKNEEGMIDESLENKEEKPQDTEAIATTVQPILDFNEEDGLVWPIVGDILLNYSMDKTIYFPTLQQYKYNPAIVISANEGENITAAADGRVISVSYDTQLGNTVVMDLGNGYELTYGQLDNITVSEGSYTAAGDIIGTVAYPTKYYSLEGANVYFKLTKDKEPINPLQKLN